MEHGEALEADFQSEYHIDLLQDLSTGQLGVLRAARLAVWLPAGARVWNSAGLDKSWTAGEHMLADVFDAINMGNWQRGGGQVAKPEPSVRPSAIAAQKHREARMLERAQRFMRNNLQEEQG